MRAITGACWKQPSCSTHSTSWNEQNPPGPSAKQRTTWRIDLAWTATRSNLRSPSWRCDPCTARCTGCAWDARANPDRPKRKAAPNNRGGLGQCAPWPKPRRPTGEFQLPLRVSDSFLRAFAATLGLVCDRASLGFLAGGTGVSTRQFG